MPVFKVHHTSNYTCICNSLIRDTSISNQALGLIVKMLSLPDGWDFSIQGLAAICKDGETRITTSINELKERGYLSITPVRLSGRIIDWRYDVFEQPQKVVNIEEELQTEADRNQEDVGSTDVIDSFDCVQTKCVKIQTTPNKDINRSIDQSKKLELEKTSSEIISYLNEKTSSNFHVCKTNNKLIKSLLSNKYTLDDMKLVVDSKCEEWLNDKTMREFLRPSTLFGDHFDEYLSAASRNRKHSSVNNVINRATEATIYKGKTYD